MSELAGRGVEFDLVEFGDYWTSCSPRMTLASVEVFSVAVPHLTCAQAGHALQRAKVLFTQGGPTFSTRGYRCRSTIILPRVDPSVFELPAAERCTGVKHRQLSFIWDWTS